MQVTNTGTVTATNVQFIDVPSPSLEFIPKCTNKWDSASRFKSIYRLFITGSCSRDSVLITFAVNVIAVPPSSSIMNTARVTGDFELIPENLRLQLRIQVIRQLHQ